MESSKRIVSRYPRITAHVIAESVGYASPSKAAQIIRDAKLRERNNREWIDACY